MLFAPPGRPASFALAKRRKPLPWLAEAVRATEHLQAQRCPFLQIVSPATCPIEESAGICRDSIAAAQAFPATDPGICSDQIRRCFQRRPPLSAQAATL